MSRTKLALHLVKGDTLRLDGKKAKVETVVHTNEMKTINVTLRLPKKEGKRAKSYIWNEEVDLWLPPKKRIRYGLLFWLAKKLRAPIKRG